MEGLIELEASATTQPEQAGDDANTAIPLILVGGEQFTEIPDDLYIPPEALQVILEAFQGPLDLLLYLIRKQNLDILNIPVALITAQYMEYVRVMRNLNLELAAEYLVMAAILGEIKSRCLLPRQDQALDEDEENDPRSELVRRLQAYEQMQQAARQLDELPRQDRDIFDTNVALPKLDIAQIQPEVDLRDVLLALRNVLTRASLFESHAVQREQLSTRQRMAQVLAIVTERQLVSFPELFAPEEGRAGVVVTFLAILELVKEALVEIIQANVFGALYVRPKSMLEQADIVASEENR